MNSRMKFYLAILIVSVIILFGSIIVINIISNDSQVEDNVLENEVQEEIKYSEDVASTLEGIETVVDANNKFAFDLYNEIDKSEEGNIFYSPYSISAALAMTYEGAVGDTKEEIKSVFYFPEDNVLRANFGKIYENINGENKEYELSTGNALWLQEGYPFNENYSKIITENYRGELQSLDFMDDVEGSRKIINSYIEEQTNNRIVNLFPQGSLTSENRFAITNAIYFKGSWEYEFDKSKTIKRSFEVSPTNSVNVDMMTFAKSKRLNYTATDELQILELPYKGGDLSMIIILPTEDIKSIELELTQEKLKNYTNNMEMTRMNIINFPKFEFDSDYKMNDMLSNLGMKRAFSSSQADFSKIGKIDNFYINSAVHKAFIKVDEEGTEAAAATGIGGSGATSMPSGEVFIVDHPFILIIQERESGNILFFGRINNPNE